MHADHHHCVDQAGLGRTRPAHSRQLGRPVDPNGVRRQSDTSSLERHPFGGRHSAIFAGDGHSGRELVQAGAAGVVCSVRVSILNRVSKL